MNKTTVDNKTEILHWYIWEKTIVFSFVCLFFNPDSHITDFKGFSEVHLVKNKIAFSKNSSFNIECKRM